MNNMVHFTIPTDMVLSGGADLVLVTKEVLDEALNRPCLPPPLQARVDAGESPLAVWREFRGMHQQTLANLAEVEKSKVSRAETGGIQKVPLAFKFAEALNCPVQCILQAPSTESTEVAREEIAAVA